WESITEYADVVSFLHCEEIYNDVEDEKQVFECIIRKNINGGLGKVSLLYEPAFHFFSEANIAPATPVLS
ncbi:MAG: hypothetical protein JXB42_02320, partial [Deltaproteobacteria bacterium]|nr:hypothetical protein [Deltaproteobacteria bacterium]